MKGVICDTQNDIVKFDREFFEKEPILEALNEFSNNYFIKMQGDENANIVNIAFVKKDKNSQDCQNLQDFIKKVISYQVKQNLDKKCEINCVK